MSSTTLIRNAAWAVAWDGERHHYLRNTDIAFAGGGITFVGKGYEGPADEVIDGHNRLVVPGLVNLHSHPSSEPLRKGITDETLSPGFHHSSLYEFLTVFDVDPQGRVACLQVAIAELLLSGCTTITDLSAPYDEWLDVLADSGIRAVVAPGFRDARWFTRDGHSLEYEWSPGAGREGFDEARRLIERARQHPCGRLGGMVYPAQVDTCRPELLRDSYDYAEEYALPWQTHAAQSVTEFHEMQRRHGKTPIRFLHSVGALGERSVIGHAIFLDHHPWLHWTTRKDLDLLVDNAVSVAHCPTVFMRRGISLRTLGAYLRRGVNVGIGTDTYPHHLLDEMRSALYCARIAGESVADLSTEDVFNAATVGSAKALGRDDIGRLAPGCRADLLLVDLGAPSMMPLREPLRSLIYVAAERAIERVYVDGELVVENGKVLTIDLHSALHELEEAQIRSLERTPSLDWAGRNAAELSPMVLPIRE